MCAGLYVYEGERAREREREWMGNDTEDRSKNLRSLQHVLIECHHFEVHKYTNMFVRICALALAMIRNAGNCCSLFARLRGILFVVYVHMQTIYRKLCGKTIVKDEPYKRTYLYTSYIPFIQLFGFCV